MGLGSGIRDPGFGKNLSRIRGSKRHRIPDPQYWKKVKNIHVLKCWIFSFEG
jgi:hypothetical protein